MRFGLVLAILVGYLIDFSNSIAFADKPTTITWTDRLKKHLFEHYDRTNRPTQHYNVTNVIVGMSIRYVNIDEASSIFTLNNWMNMQWTDDKLKWNPDDYGDLKILHASADSVWKPDLLLYNNAKTANIDHSGQTDVVINNNGTILWVPPTEYHVFCGLNLRLWPFDTQTCYVKIGSWVHDATGINLTLSGEPELATMDANEVWTIENITVKHNTITYECCSEPYVDIEYFFTLKRTASSFVVVVSPIFVILLLTLSVFWLPPYCAEKILMNGIILLLATVFLIYFAIQLPFKYGNTPLIVIFFSLTLFLTAFGAALSVILAKICRTNRCNRSIPSSGLLRKSLESRHLGAILELGCSLLPPYEDREITHRDQDEIGDVALRDWCRLAAMIDRWSFAMYLGGFMIAFVWCVV